MSKELEALNKRISDCTKCELRTTATKPVCGLGNTGAKYFIIGEAAGREEDAAGVPFIGRAGQRLSKLLAVAGIDENDCFITNVCKCRPPNNRTPRKGEIKACAQWLEEEFKLVKPEMIITLGAIPTGLFTKNGIRQVHGTLQTIKYNGNEIPITYQYHPAAALHAPRMWAVLLEDWANLPKKVNSDYIVADHLPKTAALMAADTENDESGKLGQWSIAWRAEDGQINVLPFYGKDKNFRWPDCPVWWHNWKWDSRVLQRNGMQLPKNAFDSFIGAYCMGWGKADPTSDNAGMIGGLGLKYLGRRHLGMEMKTWQEVKDKPAEMPEYNAADSVATLLLAEKFTPELPKFFWDIDMPLLPVLMKMEDRGIAIDPKYLDKFIEDLDAALQGIDLPFNPFSPKQLQKYFYEEKGYVPTKFTDTKQPSTSKEVLESFNDPMADKVIQFKGLKQDRNTYIENYIKKAGADGRIHPEFKQCSTATGRLSCANPNLQNVPKRDEVRGEMRRLFVASPGKLLVRGDFSQIELRVFAALAGEENMIKIFNEGGDIHQATADFTGLSRYDAKTINFLMLYGGGAWKISQEFHIPIDKAKEVIRRYFTQFPGIARYYEQMLGIMNETKEVSNYFGRKRRLDALYAEDWRVRKQGEREGINMPIQGTAADICKIAMIELDKHDASMVLQVHDEIIFEVEEAKAKDFGHWLKEFVPTLVEINGMKFPFEVSIGKSWYEQEPL